MDYRGKILRMSPTGSQGRANAYVCTAHYAGHVEIVPTAPGSETKHFPPIPLQGTLAGVVYDHWDDPKLIEEVKARLQSAVRDWLKTDRTDVSDFEALHKNLARLQSLDGDQPAAWLLRCQAKVVLPEGASQLRRQAGVHRVSVWVPTPNTTAANSSSSPSRRIRSMPSKPTIALPAPRSDASRSSRAMSKSRSSPAARMTSSSASSSNASMTWTRTITSRKSAMPPRRSAAS